MEPRAKDPSAPKDPVCRECRNFWITHDPQRPWGCRAFGFTSARSPAIEVRLASGRACDAFDPKPPLETR